MNQWIILAFLLAFILGYKYCSNEIKSPFFIIFFIFMVYFIYVKTYKTNEEKKLEHFASEQNNETRVVHYGDIITIWSPVSTKFLQADPTVGNKMAKYPMGRINLSQSLQSSEDIQSTMSWVTFMILDGNDPGDIGNSGPVKYGTKIFLRTVHLEDGKYIPTYISPNQDNNVYMSSERYDGAPSKSNQQIFLQSAKGLQIGLSNI